MGGQRTCLTIGVKSELIYELMIPRCAGFFGAPYDGAAVVSESGFIRDDRANILS
jgi:hypothetical protein